MQNNSVKFSWYKKTIDGKEYKERYETRTSGDGFGSKCGNFYPVLSKDFSTKTDNKGNERNFLTSVTIAYLSVHPTEDRSVSDIEELREIDLQLRTRKIQPYAFEDVKDGK